ncbi:MAG: LysM peptidoglycan-binding domain-containing protein [Kofleriaceae bacterium]
MKRTLVVFGLGAGLWPAQALAQVPVYPNGAVGQPPVSLDPGATGTQAPAPPPQQAPQPQKPAVIVVKPDGSVVDTGADSTAAPSGYYLGNGNAAPASSGGEPAEIHTGAVPELHVVRSGDTLWDICWYYFNDPWQWPKIWSYNAQITNPHWIYPGDLVRLLPRGVFAEQPGTQEPEKGGDIKPVDRVPPPSKRSEVGIRLLAFVEKKDLDKSITIDGSVDEKELLGVGDSVYLSYPSNNAPEVGKRYTIYKPGNGVRNLGSYVHILGEVEVVSVKQDKRARGIITASNQEIERGDKVGPLVKQYKSVPPVAPKVDAQGTIVALLAQEQLIGEGEIIFIDQGQASGVEVGNRMFVVRRGDALPSLARDTTGQDDRRYPARSLGQITIVEVGEKISVGLVTISVQEMAVGDTVMMQK